MTYPESRLKARVCTFYSYKGGVGRSMALANVAVLMTQWGHRVLVVDWDLEAPGLDRYFEDVTSGSIRPASNRNGIVEIAKAVSEDQELRWDDCVVAFPIPGARHALDFIPAGRRDSEYAHRLQQLDWEALFRDHNFGNRLEATRNDWLKTYDYVLIDSRTGITDIGGICTIYLPDILVALFSANHQSVEGVADVIGSRQERPIEPSRRSGCTCLRAGTRQRRKPN